ncbi:MAG: hypothetical protein U0359_04350 [Byssovorax sp.]
MTGWPVALPPIEEQQRIVGILRSIAVRIERESAVLEAQRSTKDALLSSLLTGEIRVTPDKDAP